MMRLDHNRAIAQLAAKVAVPVTDITADGRVGQSTRRRCTPTCSTPRFAASRRPGVVDDQAWIENDFLPNVGKRGAAIIEARGSSSAASAASAAIDHVNDWVTGNVDWVSMGIPSDGSYGIPEGLICGFPCICTDGRVGDRPGPRARRLLARQDRRLRRRAHRRARHRQRAGPDLAGDAIRGPVCESSLTEHGLDKRRARSKDRAPFLQFKEVRRIRAALQSRD